MSRPPRTTLATAAVVLALVLASAPAAVGAPADAASSDRPSTAVPSDDENAAVSATIPSDDENASVSAWRVPHYVDAANASASELASYRDDRGGDGRESDADPGAAANVTPHDRLAVAVHVPGLDDVVANESGNHSAHVLGALDERGHFAVRQTVDTTTVERWPKSLWLNASNVRAVDAPGDDRYVLLVDPERVLAVHADTFEAPSAAADEYRDDDEDYRFDGVFEDGFAEMYTARYYANESDRGLTATSRRVRFRPAVATLDAAGPLERAANATVAGATTVAPGTDLVVAVRDDGRLLATANATVSANGTFAATVDLSTVDQPLSADVTVATADRERTLTREPVTVPVRDATARVAFPDQTSTTRYVSVRANLTHGGVLVLRNDSGVVDASTTIAPGANQTVTFTVPDDAQNGTYTVVAHRGTPGDRGARYPDGTATATLQFADEDDEDDGDDGDAGDDDPATTTTPTPTTTDPTDETTGTTGITTGPWTTAGGTAVADDPIPGFSVPMALAAVAALLGTVASRYRREN